MLGAEPAFSLQILGRFLSHRVTEPPNLDIVHVCCTNAFAGVERHVSDAGPVRVEYALTDKGRALEPTVRALKSWAHNWLPRQ